MPTRRACDTATTPGMHFYSAGRSTPDIFRAWPPLRSRRSCVKHCGGKSQRRRCRIATSFRRWFSSVIIRRDRIEVEHRRKPDRDELGSTGNLMIPFSPAVSAQRGITREPADNRHIDAVGRENVLNAIRRASAWAEAVNRDKRNPPRRLPLERGWADATSGGWRSSRSLLLKFWKHLQPVRRPLT